MSSVRRRKGGAGAGAGGNGGGRPNGPTDQTATSPVAFVGVFAIVVAVGACVWWLSGIGLDGSIHPHTPHTALDQPCRPTTIDVRRIAGRADGAFPSDDDISAIIAAGQPVILTGLAADWPAVAKWTPEFLASRMGKLRGVKRNKSPVFRYFESNAIMLDVPGLAFPTPFEEVDMSAPTFLRHMSRPHDEEAEWWYYYSGLLSSDLKEDVAPAMRFAAGRAAGGDDEIVQTMWIGNENVTAQAHYDSYHNFYTQVYGVKEFLLFPPTAYDALYVYPRIHPSFRQSQIDLSGGETLRARFPRFCGVAGMTAVLSPGDVLYLPPFWFHHVTARTLSISANVWFQSDAFAAVERIFHAAIPFEAEWDEVQALAATQTYLAMLVEQAVPGMDAHRFVSHLLHLRYDNIYPPAAREAAKRAGVCDFDAAGLAVPPAQLRADLQRGIDTLLPLFAELPPGVREIHVGNYIEHLGVWAVGETERLYPFLQSCFPPGL